MTATRVIDDHIELANIGTKTHAEIEGHIQGIGNYTLPAADGNADQLLKTSGAGVLSWIDKPAGFACGSLNACNLTDIGTRAHSSLTGIGASDHHVKYTDAEVDAIVATHTAIDNAHHEPYTDDMAVDACDNSNVFFERNVENEVIGTQKIKNVGAGAGCLLHLEREDTGNFFVCDGLFTEVKSTTHTFNNILAAVNFATMYIQGTDTRRSIGAISFIKWNGQNQSAIWFGVINPTLSSVTVMKMEHDKVSVEKLLFIRTIKSGATQAGAGAAANEIWKTNGHATLPNNVLLIGV